MADWSERIPAVLAQVGLTASPRQLEQLAGYMALLQRWNATYNLTALRSPQDMLSHHLADCLVVVAPLLRHLGLSSEQAQQTHASHKLLDVGSGGGLPGVVLAILCPAVAVTCVDTVGKKAAFIRQVAAELALPNLRGEHARVEALKGEFHVVASRAFASLPDFTRWTRHLLTPASVWMAMKGKQPEDELAELQGLARVEAIEPLSVPGLDAERCIVWMRLPSA
ncbi:MAG TPA: 16S rRNA (guanine(527)-N(7))-methyltransferase RsmG [Aquabacterium sp.]|uniref:16S rRNA (guanine(527)-N(7))-methyltransferase RsmG n=1 Tax=Aquabacterium sp. TaxID=1872578 RepID=UPI002E309106|nr:16S rRNA (guanine(527)-N(7))-methyltransferase RsmG [Aquabacterium sp.]HEX5373926.1 16S rRNA (guanine(527)-N(7))-methyltransferase RsmG [Aquabacterium sp.]